jgi:hypothetical protein
LALRSSSANRASNFMASLYSSFVNMTVSIFDEPIPACCLCYVGGDGKQLFRISSMRAELASPNLIKK